ncbi:uncharacterized protein LOC117228615 [Megalopta genalis]|uniref:uncharacterized protein LOC117228615 n=1 Tax=Megalopta genalis TaxID=115081 RepID=UPI0014433DA7|nr:uncharacterized protein LOC117228615 [Megalopta genalis]
MSSPLTCKKRANSVSFTKMIDANQISNKVNSVHRESDTALFRGSNKTLSLANSASVYLLNALDVLLLIIVAPYMFWQCATANDRVKIIARAVLEVALELLMWMIFAGVSVLMTAAFLLENTYLGKSDSDRAQPIDIKFVNPRNSRIPDSHDFSTRPEEPRNPD